MKIGTLKVQYFDYKSPDNPLNTSVLCLTQGFPPIFTSMTEFQAYLSFGFDHIFNFDAYDHILFIATLVAAYDMAFWKRMILILTAFTIGHSITLALSALGIFSMNNVLVEVLIACTILIAACYNLLLQRKTNSSPSILFQYLIATCFGLIHGLGFAGQFRALMGSGNEVLVALLAFNIGVELGQIVIIGIFLIILFLATRLLKISHHILCIGISLIAGITAIVLIVQRMQTL